MMILLSAVARAACPSTSGDVFLIAERAEAAFQELDRDKFRIVTDLLVAEVACVREQLPRDLVARIHRIEGLRAFVDGDPNRAQAAFASARGIEPSYRFPEALVPLDHPVQQHYLVVDPHHAPLAAVPPPADGRIEVDGRVGDGLPETRPAVVQWIRTDGSVPRSMYRWPGVALFEYPSAPQSATAPTLPPPLAPSRAPRTREARTNPPPTSRPLAVASGVGLVAAGALLGVSASSRAAYFSPDATVGELDSLRARTNDLYWASVGVGAVGLGLGATALVVHRW